MVVPIRSNKKYSLLSTKEGHATNFINSGPKLLSDQIWNVTSLCRPSTSLYFTENQPSVSIIHIQSQIVFVFWAFTASRLPACLGFPQDRPSGLLPLLLSLLLCGALCRKLYNWVVSHQLARRGHGLGHTSVTRGREGGQGGGGVEGIRRGRTMVALCHTAPSILCATCIHLYTTCSEGWCHSARSSTPWIGQDFVSNSQRSQRVSVQCLCKMQ